MRRVQQVQFTTCEGWLPPGKRAAVCFNVDDIHPATSHDHIEAGGDLGRGALGHLVRLLEANPRLKATLFVTPDWRLRHLVPTRGWPTRVPILRNHIHWSPRVPNGCFRIDRFPLFADYLNTLPRTECAVHGLRHAHPGPRMAVEFQRQSVRRCGRMLEQARGLFVAAGLRHVPGFAAPAWHTPPALCAALSQAGFRYVTSARDLDTPIRPGALAEGSGLRGAPLASPAWLRVGPSTGRPDGRDGLVHFATNFQATSTPDRAHAIVEAGGLLSIKAHVFKAGGGLTMLDGLDDPYCEFLGRLCRQLDNRYGDTLWWTTFAEVATRCRNSAH